MRDSFEMNLGAFSVSLAVKDLGKSKAFYEKLGFETMGGNADQGFLILQNGEHVIGLFQGMFPKNILTFNPGWDQSAKPTEDFTDVRELREKLVADGVTMKTPPPESDAGPASFMIEDPDGNPILVDQHR